MASNTGEPDQSDNQYADEAESTHTPRHSQTLPLITEEIAAARPGAAPIPTQHVTTPVIPPNPIRRDDSTMPVGTPTGIMIESGSDPEAQDAPENEKSSEGRISATQLIAGAGAAATSSVIGGQLGVAGTVVGAGVASIVTALAVTLYGRSLDKGKEKIQEVGSKLAPAVKAKIAKSPDAAKPAAVDPSLAEDSAFAPPEPTGDYARSTAASAKEDEPGEHAEQSGSGTAAQPRTWWQKLRRKRVLYPVTIGVAAFGIGLGAVVVAENFTDADISPGTSQISRSVSGQSTTGEETNTGTSDSGSSGEGSSSGSGSGADGQQSSTDSGSDGQTGQSTSAGETGSQGTDSGQTDQGADTTTDTGTDTGSTTADGTDTGSGTTASDSAGSTGSAADSSGGTDGSSGTGGSGSSADSGGSSGSGTGGSDGGSGGGSAASAQG